MKSSARLAIHLSVFFAFAACSRACGPFFTEAVFVQRSGPDGPYAAYVGGRIGVPQPGYRMRYLVVAYDWLNGHGLSPAEQQQAMELESARIPSSLQRDSPDASAGLTAWIAARQASGVPGGPRDVAAQPNQPWTAKTALQSQATDLPVPGDPYQTFPNCLSDAFATAAETLRSRKAAHADDPTSFSDWVHGQDAVFTHCGDAGKDLPEPSSSKDAPRWLRQDRAYQLAAAKFYSTDYDGAIAQLRLIAQDNSSPWHQTARFVIARAMIRRATVGQTSDFPAATNASRNPSAEQSIYQLQRDNATRLAKRSVSLTQARDLLRSILADPTMTDFHASATGLLDLVMLRLDPVTQAQILSKRLIGPGRPQTPGVFRQALIDLSYFPNGVVPEEGAESKVSPLPGQREQLLPWIRAMRNADRNPRRESLFVTYDAIQKDDLRAAEAERTAFLAWQQTHSTPWLVAALTAAQPGSQQVSELLRAAAAVPPDSPAFLICVYSRLRLTESTPATRNELKDLLPVLSRDQSRSTVNLFTMLDQRSAPTLSAFLYDAGNLPAGFITDTDDPDPPSTDPNPKALCHMNSSEAETRLFDHQAASILNTRMPLSLLAEAAESQSLQPNLRFQIAQATWARAVLLGVPQTAQRMSPLLITCYPAWKPWLEAYDRASTPDDREAAGLLSLMRFASTEPIVRDGEERPEGFAAYSQYRDNWWQESKKGGPPTNPDRTKSADGTVLQTFFGTVPATQAELPNPPFLKATDITVAKREIDLLRTIPGASDYFAEAALAWQRKHPSDPRTPDILGFAERVIRNGVRTDKTSELNHQLFLILQAKYPNSEWARKYTSWE
jgi:hypothetical protein